MDSAGGGTFIEANFGDDTKLLANIMTKYSQWHTKRAPSGKKVNSVEEIATLSEKVDARMNLVANKNAHFDPNYIPLYNLIEKNGNSIDVNFILRNNFNDNAYRGTIKDLNLVRERPNCLKGDDSNAKTEKVVEAMVKAYDEKLELEVSIPRKLYDEWEPTIKIKIKEYECNFLCDLGASVSTIPKSLCDVLGLTNIHECSLNLHLADSTMKKPLERINVVLIIANRNYVHVYFIVLDI
nr:retropepsin domain-containing protein [Hordeum vulgare subsp. vulgare]